MGVTFGVFGAFVHQPDEHRLTIAVEMSLLLSGPSSITPWLEEAAFLAILGKSYSKRPRLVQVLRRSTFSGRDLLFVHDGTTSVAALIDTHHENKEEPQPVLESAISRGCIVRISEWVVSSLPLGFHIPAQQDGTALTTLCPTICLEVKNVELLGGHGMGIVGDAYDVNESVDVRRALMSIHHDPQVLKQRLRRFTEPKHAATGQLLQNSANQTVLTANGHSDYSMDREPNGSTPSRGNFDLWDTILEKGDSDVPPLQQNPTDQDFHHAPFDRKQKSLVGQVAVSSKEPNSIIRLGDLSLLGACETFNVSNADNHNAVLGDVHALFGDDTKDQRSRLDDILNEADKYREGSKHDSSATNGATASPQERCTANRSRLSGQVEETSMNDDASSVSTVEMALGDGTALLKGYLRLSVDDGILGTRTQPCADQQFEITHGSEDGNRGSRNKCRHQNNMGKGSDRLSNPTSDVILGDVAALLASKGQTTFEDVLIKANCRDSSCDISMDLRDTSVEAATVVKTRVEAATVGDPRVDPTSGVTLGEVTALFDGRGRATFEDVIVKANQYRYATTNPSFRNQVDSDQTQCNFGTQEVLRGTTAAGECNSSEFVDRQNVAPDWDDNDQVSSDSDGQSEVAGISTMLASQEDDQNSTADAMDHGLVLFHQHTETKPRMVDEPLKQPEAQPEVKRSQSTRAIPDAEQLLQEQDDGMKSNKDLISNENDDHIQNSVCDTEGPSHSTGPNPVEQVLQEEDNGMKSNTELVSNENDGDFRENDSFQLDKSSSQEAITQDDRFASEPGRNENGERPIATTEPSSQTQPMLVCARANRLRGEKPGLMKDSRPKKSCFNLLLTREISDIPISVQTKAALHAGLGNKLPFLLRTKRRQQVSTKSGDRCADESSHPRHKKPKTEPPSLLDCIVQLMNDGKVFSFRKPPMATSTRRNSACVPS